MVQVGEEYKTPGYYDKGQVGGTECSGTWGWHGGICMMRLSSDRGLLSWIESLIRQGVGFCTLVPGFDLGETGRGPGDVGGQPLLAAEAGCYGQAERKKS